MNELQAALHLNVTDKELARASGMSQQAINNYRTGKAQAENMRFKHAMRLIEYLKESENELK